MAYSKGKAAARKLLKECGVEDPTAYPLERIVAGRGATLIVEPMTSADGRIVHGKRKSIIKINANIEYAGRRRFALAHELGHFEMHRDYPIHNDSKCLDWWGDAIKKLKHGKQEFEANEFASELLMPMALFKEEAQYKTFSPKLINKLANRFKTSITSTVFKYLEANLHPIAVFHIANGKVKYWKKSDDFNVFLKNLNGLKPPLDSVATEYIKNSYLPIYKKNELQQEIDKSTWVQLRDDEDDSDFHEYCIVTQKYKSILSVIWEN